MDMTQDKRDLLVKTAIKLFAQNGFDNTSTASISKTSKVATGTLFHYFKNKEDLIISAYAETKQELFEIIASNISEKDSLETIIKKTYKHCILWGLDNPNETKFIFQVKTSPYNVLAKKKVEDQTKYFHEMIQHGIKQKMIKNIPIDLIEDLMTNHMLSSISYFVSKKSNDVRLIDRLADSLWDSIKRD